MSSFSEILSDIGGGAPQQRLQTQTLRPQIQRPTQLASNPRPNGSANGTSGPSIGSTDSLKRRLDPGKVESPASKNPKLSAGSSLASTKSAVPLQGVKSASIPASNRPRPDVISKFPAPKLPGPASGTSGTSQAPPKKGSFRELMERGRRAHEAGIAQGHGQIKHKEAEKNVRHDRLKVNLQEKQKALASGKGTAKAVANRVLSVKPNSKIGASKAEAPPPPKKKERPPLDYKGTMRSQPSSKPRPAATARSTSAPRTRRDEYEDEDMEDDDDPYAKRYRYAGSSDEDEDEDDDMVGGGFDELEAEEELSLRAARQEDAAALREEAAHRNEKLTRKKQLEALKNARAAKR